MIVVDGPSSFWLSARLVRYEGERRLSDQDKLIRGVGLFDATMLVMGGIVGLGHLY